MGKLCRNVVSQVKTKKHRSGFFLKFKEPESNVSQCCTAHLLNITMISMVKLLIDKNVSRRHKIMAAMNIFGFCHFTFMIVVTTYFGSFVIVPQLYGNSSGHLYYHYTSIVVLVMNTAGYFINAVVTDTTKRKLYTDHDRTGGLLKTVEEQYHQVTFANKKCKVCDVRMPARCHHCALCGICVS